MPSSTSFTVALVLTAVNSMSSVLRQSQESLRQYSAQLRQVSGEVDRYNQRISDLEKSAKKYEQIKNSGAQDIQNGLLMMVPVEEALRQAAKFEGVLKKVENALYDGAVPLEEQQLRMEALKKQAEELGTITTFNNIEAAQAQLALIRNGMEFEDVIRGGAQAAMYLAQTAEIAPAAAADAVSQITNMFQLQGNQLLQVADDINRAANASSAGVQNIMHDLQQAGMSAHTLGLKVKETVLMLGVLHNMGLGDASGTYLNDMLINLDKMTPKARQALQAMGWLEGATVQYTKSGKMKIIGGENSLFNEKGEIKSAEELVKRLRSVLFENSGLRPEDLRDEKGQLLPQEEIERILQAKNKLEALQHLKDVFGIQGMRAAVALATPGKGSYEEMVEKAERAKRIQDQVLEWQDTLLGKVETLKGSWETLMTQTGSPLTNEVGKMVSEITEAINAVGKWANANPQLAASIIRIIGYLALFKIGIGGAKFLLGDIVGFANRTAGVIMRIIRYSHGFFDTYKYFRQGAGIFRSLWSAVVFGNPILTRVTVLASRFGGALLRLGVQALATAARLAAAWVIGLGPVGWIIGGVTLAVTAAVVAWKKNLGGFRDWAIGWAKKIVELVNKVRTALHMKPWEVDFGENRGVGDLRRLESETPLVKMPSSQDNRQYVFNIENPDPVAVAREVARVTGAPDKYTMSRDPRFGEYDFGVAGA